MNRRWIRLPLTLMMLASLLVGTASTGSAQATLNSPRSDYVDAYDQPLIAASNINPTALMLQSSEEQIGRIIGTVLDATDQHPITNAGIAIEGWNLVAGTEANGIFTIDNIILSNAVVPITITATAPGYGLWQLANVDLVANDSLILDISLSPGETPTIRALPAPTARHGDACQESEGMPGILTPERLQALTQMALTVPATIRVGRQSSGWPNCQGGAFTQVDVVSFKDYVKHVLPHEWIQSWPVESLKAGAMAAKHYGWYWISVGGKWGGHNPPADVMDSTCDQVYDPSVSYASTNAAVDATWDYAMTNSSGNLFQPHFCSHCQNVCSFCTDRCGIDCMGQWDSRDQANLGKNWQDILRYFYAGINIQVLNCPTSGGVILYKDENYSCGGEGDGSGYVQRTSAGRQDVPSTFNDRASSIRVPSGWSVKLYEHGNRGGGSACRTGDDVTFWGEQFSNGVALNDNVSSFEVFNTANCGVNDPPNIPTLQSPADGYAATNGQSPTLSWRNNGDPNGDQVQFYVEVYDSPVTANSGWISNVNWRPASLDGRYHTYKWHVKARDSAGLESAWSSTRQFTIQSQPPSIAFNTANGSSATLIESRDQAWAFLGTASDPDGQVTRVEFRCSGDNCGSGATQSTGTTSWSLARSAMAGKNDVYFRAFDNQGVWADSRHLDLRIDLAAPTTSYNLVGTLGENGWYVSPVEVRFHADDGATGNVRVGVARIHYRVDDGDWQHPSGGDARFTVSSDGPHTVDYYAEDKVGNPEEQKQLTFKIDATLPTVPSAIAESHGVVSEQWQKDWSDPAFTWTAANDATSGVWYYRVSWGDTLHFPTSPAFVPLAVRTGSYELRIRAVDRAGNIGPESALFTFQYDGSRPHTPDIQNLDGVASGVWQNLVRTPNFSWPTPFDEGSGVVGYNIYWGTDDQGSSTVLSTANSFASATPICAADSAATYYLRARSQDGVGLQSDWVSYALRYDGAPPTLTLTVNYGQPVVHQRNVYVNIAALDLGSGVTKMRLSTEGYTWTDWQDYLPEFYWEIPSVGRRTYDIYAQVHDGVGNMSPIVSATVYFDVNSPLPNSESFQLWDWIVPSGAGIITGSNPSTYTMRVTIGQPTESLLLTNLHYQLRSGFQAGALAVPTVTPTYTTYVQIGSLLASATTSATAMASTHHRLYGSLGQPSDMQTVASTNYIADLGFWAGAARDVVPQPPEPPEPPLPPECEFYSLSINNGALFTRDPQVTLNMCGPDPTQMMLSNDGGFGSAIWQPYTTTISWMLTTYGDTIIPRFVYARYKDPQDVIHGTFFDDIIYDPTAPAGTAAFDPAALLSDGVVRQAAQSRAPRPLRVVQEREAELFLSVSDDSSGLAEMQVSFTPEFSETTWQPYSAITPVAFADDGLHTIYIRTRDQAGNVSEPISDSLMVDTTPPVLHPDGILAFAPDIVGPETLSATLIVYGYDNLTSISEMRISQSADFTDTLWVPYIPEYTVPISFTSEVQPVWYVQVRDEAGNASETYTVTYTVDVTPPVVYVEVSPGDTLTRTLTILVYDDLSRMGDMRLSNDPLMLDNVVTMPYSTTVTWDFDERRIVWVQVADSVGNFSEPFPAYAAEILPNQAPYTPANPIPANGATGVPTTTLLTWEGGDPNGDMVTYTITMSRTGWSTVFLPPVVTSSTVVSYTPGLLELDVTYEWNVSASDGMSVTVGPTWSFSTGIATGDYKVYLPLVLRE